MKIYYRSNDGKILDFTKLPYKMLKDTDLFDYERDYETRGDLNQKITRFKRGMVSKSISVIIQGTNEAECQKAAKNFWEVTEKDVISQTPGRFYVGDFYFPCYFVSSSKSEWKGGANLLKNDFSIISEHGMWLKETTYVFRVNASLPSTAGNQNLDFPHDFKYDYASGMTGRTIHHTGISPANFEITIYGSCINPSVNIGGETYRVYASLDTGEYLKINSITKKIYKVKINGEIVNQFNLRDRDPQPYFRKIDPGINAVTWSGAYGVDVTLFEERSEPEWT